MRSNLLTLSEHARQADLARAAGQIRALGGQRRRWRILGSAGLVVAAVVIAVIIALTGTASTLSKPSSGQPTSPGAAKFVPNTVEVVAAPDPANDIGYLTAAQLIGGQLVVTFDRVSWLTGAQAVKQNGGVEPPKGHLIVNNNRRLRTFVLDDAARLLGGVQLAGHGGTAGTASTRITRQQLIERTAALVGTHGQGPLVSLAHRFGVDGPVSGLKEISNP